MPNEKRLDRYLTGIPLALTLGGILVAGIATATRMEFTIAAHSQTLKGVQESAVDKEKRLQNLETQTAVQNTQIRIIVDEVKKQAQDAKEDRRVIIDTLRAMKK